MGNKLGAFNEPTQWHDYINKDPQCFCSYNGGHAYGVLRSINKEEGYAEIQPSIVFNIDGSQASVNNQIPTRLPLPLGIIRPLPERMSLEDYVNDYNKRKEEEIRARTSQKGSNILLPDKDFHYP